MLSIKEFEEGKFVFMATSFGTVKKTSLALFSRRGRAASSRSRSTPATVGRRPITDGTKDILLFTTGARRFAFHGDEVRPMAPRSAGVRGVN